MSEIDIAAIVRGITTGAIPVLFAITLHEVAHGWVARACGDSTAAMLGRLSLNPIRHVDPTGTILTPLLVFTLSLGNFIFGWAKPVPVNFSNLNKPRRDMIAVAAAGPAANVAMGLFWAVVYQLTRKLVPPGDAYLFLIQMSQIGIFFNSLLAVFNLIPLPPLDGGRVLRGLVSEPFGRRLDAIEPYGLIIVVLLLLTGVIRPVLVPAINALISLLIALAGGGSA